ncbi:hypothetical protein NDU88_002599 [Pleurodeles waltl]|uniref:Uncharacterized protein n=1 Tax=Pleurodeles waltl TaxID=8319 RepID=A0AAV7UW27_PLEWA|nr:hypothetical protein NDU88_002599 [Pleurodeles waltl]
MNECRHKQHARLATAERRICDIEDDHTQQDKEMKEMHTEIPHIQLKNEDLEARTQRSNMRVADILESTATGRTKDYLEKLLLALFRAEKFFKTFVIKQAYCSLAPKPVPGELPRPIIAKLLNYRDMDQLL